MANPFSAVDDSWATTEIFVRGASAGAAALPSSAPTTVLRGAGEGDEPILTLDSPRALVRLERLVLEAPLAVLQGTLEITNCDFYLPTSATGRRRALRASQLPSHHLWPYHQLQDQLLDQSSFSWSPHRQLNSPLNEGGANNSAIKVDGGSVSLRGVTFDAFRTRAVTVFSGTLTADSCTLKNYYAADVGGAMVRWAPRWIISTLHPVHWHPYPQDLLATGSSNPLYAPGGPSRLCSLTD